MGKISCDKRNCLNWKEGYCFFSNPEKAGDVCLDFEDALDFLRIKADAVKGTLG